MNTFVIFGASGDLTRRKLIPALFALHCKERLPDDTRIVGFSRTAFSHAAWRHELAASTRQAVGEHFESAAWEAFAARVFYQPGDITTPADFPRLRNFLDDLEQGTAHRVYYLSTAPRFYEPAIEHLGSSGLAAEGFGSRRLVIEKPFGSDRESAEALNAALHRVFREDQVYRIDHYLGKETVQNILVLRFANSIFEPIWNRNYIDHVQITVAEEVDLGNRGGYYDRAGVLRDMMQNHLLQLLMITAMETPVRYTADMVRDEKVKVLQAMRPLSAEDVARDTVRGRYAGYIDEPDVSPDSRTATFGAIKLSIDNWRWQGVPFYLRTGKAMSCRTTQIVVQFRRPPHMLFQDGAARHIDGNRLVIQVQPAEGIQLQFHTKVPDAGMKLGLTDLDFRFDRHYHTAPPDAYQRLLLDAMQGDASLFARADEVELAWNIIDPIQTAWDAGEAPPLAEYPRGDWGPASCTKWIEQQGREWFDVCPVLH